MKNSTKPKKRYPCKREKEHKKKYVRTHPWSKCLIAARQRCTNKNQGAYKYYGEKGIECFLTIHQVKYLFERDGGWKMKKPSLDRINPKGNYTLKNCRFLEVSENARRAVRGKKFSKERCENIRKGVNLYFKKRKEAATNG